MFNHSFAFVTLSSYFNILRLIPLKYSWGLEGRGPQKIKLKRGLFLIRYTRPSHPKVCCVSNVLYTTYVQRETNIDVIPDSVITFLSPESAPICWCPPLFGRCSIAPALCHLVVMPILFCPQFLFAHYATNWVCFIIHSACIIIEGSLLRASIFDHRRGYSPLPRGRKQDMKFTNWEPMTQ